VRISLLAEVAMEYVQLRSDQQRERILRANLDTQRRSWRLAQDKLEGGVGSETEAAQASALVRSTEAMLPSILAAQKAARHALAFMIGQNPDALDDELAAAKALPPLPPDVPLGVPSDLLRRRPDIRQAERQVAVAFANVGIAKAALFPQFSITGAFGLDSSTVKQLPDWSSHYYSIAPGVRWPILDWNRLHAGIRVENEEQSQALIAYDNAVAQALRDVADALIKYEAEKDRRRSLVQALAESRRAQRVAVQTFDAGLADQAASLEAAKATLQAEDQLAQSDASLRSDVIALYKALGGGWDAPPAS
jgi:NodT family efflux transporter outer membrane factor (OMF) lipoprotein